MDTRTFNQVESILMRFLAEDDLDKAIFLLRKLVELVRAARIEDLEARIEGLETKRKTAS